MDASKRFFVTCQDYNILCLLIKEKKNFFQLSQVRVNKRKFAFQTQKSHSVVTTQFQDMHNNASKCASYAQNRLDMNKAKCNVLPRTFSDRITNQKFISLQIKFAC